MKNNTEKLTVSGLETGLICFPGNYQSPWESPSLSESWYNSDGLEITLAPELAKGKGRHGFDNVLFHAVEKSGAFTDRQEELERLFVSSWVSEILESPELSALVSTDTPAQFSVERPREYNFRDDEIFLSFTIPDFSAWVAFVEKCKADSAFSGVFEKLILDRHTSRSGFISFHSNDPADHWESLVDAEKAENGKSSIHSFSAFFEAYRQTRADFDEDEICAYFYRISENLIDELGYAVSPSDAEECIRFFNAAGFHAVECSDGSLLVGEDEDDCEAYFTQAEKENAGE